MLEFDFDSRIKTKVLWFEFVYQTKTQALDFDCQKRMQLHNQVMLKFLEAEKQTKILILDFDNQKLMLFLGSGFRRSMLPLELVIVQELLFLELTDFELKLFTVPLVS